MAGIDHRNIRQNEDYSWRCVIGHVDLSN